MKILLEAARLARNGTIAANVILCGLVAWSCFGQQPPTPTIDTNAAQVGSVNVAWDDMTAIDPSIEWYGVYLGTTNVVVVATNAATVPLYDYGTNWISVSSIDASLLESDPSAPIAVNFVAQPITNIVSISLTRSTNLHDWQFVSTVLTMTNPPGNRVYRLMITNQTQ